MIPIPDTTKWAVFEEMLSQFGEVSFAHPSKLFFKPGRSNIYLWITQQESGDFTITYARRDIIAKLLVKANDPLKSFYDVTELPENNFGITLAALGFIIQAMISKA